jgi:large subunit ribosomal protein L17
MFRNMLVSLINHERIKTTLTKAKELRGWMDRMITLGKKNTLHARRQAFALLRDETIVKKLFDEISPRLKDREGGYTRIYRLGWRQGDGAPLSLIELLSYVAPDKKKTTAKKAKEVHGKVSLKKKKGKEEATEGEKKGKGKKGEEAKKPSGKKSTKKTPEEKTG